LLANVGMLIGIVVMSVTAGGSTQTDALIALGIVGVWILVGAVWLVFNSLGSNKSLLVSPATGVSPER